MRAERSSRCGDRQPETQSYLRERRHDAITTCRRLFGANESDNGPALCSEIQFSSTLAILSVCPSSVNSFNAGLQAAENAAILICSAKLTRMSAVVGHGAPAIWLSWPGLCYRARQRTPKSATYRRSAMAGHSQFKNIMHRKGRQDPVSAQLFTGLQREIPVASKAGLPDPAFNPRLRAAIQAAKAANMPKDNIERAIKRGQGGDGENYDEVRYEGYGPGGVAVIVEALTDNRNRTASRVRSSFGKHGGALGETNSVSFQFNRVGQINYPATVAGADAMLEAAIEAGARGLREHRRRSRDHLRRRRAGRRAGEAGGGFGAARAGGPDLEAAEHRCRSRTTRPRRCSSCWRRWTTTTTCSAWSRISRSRKRRWRGCRLTRAMLILGLDPGLRHTGWGVVEASGKQLRFVACGAVHTDAADDLADRLVSALCGPGAGDRRPPAERGRGRGDGGQQERRLLAQAWSRARRRAPGRRSARGTRGARNMPPSRSNER